MVRSFTLAKAPEPSQPNVTIDDAGKELVDPPLYREPLSYALSSKTIKFTITSEDGASLTRVVLDPITFNYRADTNYEDGFYYVHASGSVCFSKPGFKNIYCLREKYTMAAMARYFTGDANLNIRELNEDEKTILDFMNDLGWNPNNALASSMTGVELAINLLRQQKLKDGASLEIFDGKKVVKAGIIKDVQSLEAREDMRIQGINMATILALIYNKQQGDETEYMLGLPLINLESAKTDDDFENISNDYGIDIHKYILYQ